MNEQFDALDLATMLVFVLFVSIVLYVLVTNLFRFLWSLFRQDRD